MWVTEYPACLPEYLEELRECAPTYTLWSGSEEEQLAEPLKGVYNENVCQNIVYSRGMVEVQGDWQIKW